MPAGCQIKQERIFLPADRVILPVRGIRESQGGGFLKGQLPVDKKLAGGVHVPAVLLPAFNEDFIQAVLFHLNLPCDTRPWGFPVIGAYVVQRIARASARRGGGRASIRLRQDGFAVFIERQFSLHRLAVIRRRPVSQPLIFPLNLRVSRNLVRSRKPDGTNRQAFTIQGNAQGVFPRRKPE